MSDIVIGYILMIFMSGIFWSPLLYYYNFRYHTKTLQALYHMIVIMHETIMIIRDTIMIMRETFRYDHFSVIFRVYVCSNKDNF